MGQFLTTERQKEILAPLAPEQRREALTKLVERGHEIEGLNTSFSPLNAAKNVPGSLVEFGKNIVRSVVDVQSDESGIDFQFTLPQTLKTVANLGLGAAVKVAEAVGGDPDKSLGASILKAAGGDIDEARKTAEAFGTFFQQRYGSKQKALETVERDPAGFLSDLATLVGGGAGAVSKLTGTTGKLGKVGRAAETVAAAGRGLEPTSLAGKGAGAVAKAAKPLTEPVLAKIHQASGIRKLVSKAEARSLGITLGEQAKIGEKTKIADAPGALARLGVQGSMPEMSKQLGDIAESSRKFLTDKLAEIPGKVKSSAAKRTVGALVDEIDKLPDNLKTSNYNAMRAEALFFRDKLSRDGLNLTQLNRVKKMGDDLFNIYTEGGKVKGNLRAEAMAEIRSTLRKQIEDVAADSGFEEVQRLNQNISLAETTKRYMDRAIRKIPARRKNLFFDLVATIGAGGAAAAAATGNFLYLFGVGLVFGAQRLATNPKIQSTFANKLASISDADFNAIEKMIRSQKPTIKGRRAVRKMLKELQPAFPEIRLASLVGQETENQ